MHGSTSNSCAGPDRRSLRRSGTRRTSCSRCARTCPISQSRTCPSGRSRFRKTTSRWERAVAKPAAASDTRSLGGSSTRLRPRKLPRSSERGESLDGERLFRQSLGRGDELRHALFRIREDRVAAAVECEAFLEYGHSLVERQVPAGKGVHPFLARSQGSLERRLVRHAPCPPPCR